MTITQETRDSIRKTVADMERCQADEEWGGSKAIYLANLEGYLGRYPLALLNALEAAEARVGELEAERQHILDCINLYGDEVLHSALDAAGLLMDGRKAA